MHYLTRHLEALTEISHGDQLQRKGDRFYATPVDAEYYLKHRKVSEVKDEEAKPVAKPTPQVEPEAPQMFKQTRRARPAIQEPAAPPADSLIMTSRDVPGPAQDLAQPADAAKPSNDA